ncbi:Lacal_2735 family protein [Subsaxibacter sp. CAU 1640]|uniref:Lacal_2735 family protein n=1 Tax=Subsaxibacter sp. CAU 1640 TaxID=2933271 RepID=UPI002006D3BF|nr:Lacal_2735 family protein [Subsaxibacter sp. CAU 1640]MCK7591400.1 Lacal_2735 family protein [Subsaxibacter sp. CAU 1640]
MNTHFCKVGKTKLGLSEVLNLKELEINYKKFVEEAYNLIQTDAGLSDFLYHEASKLKKTILNLKKTLSKDLDAAI